MPQEGEIKYIVRIAGTDLDGTKKVELALTGVKGIGRRLARAISLDLGIDPSKKLGELSEEEIEKIENAIGDLRRTTVPKWMFNRKKDYEEGVDKHLIGSDLVMQIREDVNRLKRIRSYRGIRHELGLPLRGQRTRANFRRGPVIGVRRRKKK
ncbi:30S ribosomal protein S13 [Thermococci archaeon]|nr:MAG: 30S ribosomal protein S13 [Thermococci archaeon]RLF97044.1 MAG: 30S ribosomal protein S13 [Thermococci archaeon]